MVQFPSSDVEQYLYLFMFRAISEGSLRNEVPTLLPGQYANRRSYCAVLPDVLAPYLEATVLAQESPLKNGMNYLDQ